MAQTMHLALFGPVFCPYPFPTLLALSSLALGSLSFVCFGHCCCRGQGGEEVVVVVMVVVIDVDVVVVVVVVMPRCHAKNVYKIIF